MRNWEWLNQAQGPEEMCLSLEHQNWKNGLFWSRYRQLRYRFFRPQTKRLRASVTLRATWCASGSAPVERPSYLRSDFVNLQRHARLEVFNILKYAIHLHFDRLCTTCLILVRDFVPLFRSFLDWFQSMQTRRCHCLRLKDRCFDVSSLFLLRGEKDLSVDVTK